jgi:hypothetical protein
MAWTAHEAQAQGGVTMSEFVFLFRSSEADRRAAMGTPERAQRAIQAWTAWMRDLQAKGHLKERGRPLETTGKVVRKKGMTDGPYAETKDIVLGFIIVEASDLAQACALAEGCPFVAGEGVVEVRPVDAARAMER